MKKRVLSLFMALALCFSMLPTAALAEEAGTAPDAANANSTYTTGEDAGLAGGEDDSVPDDTDGEADTAVSAAQETPHANHCVCGKGSSTTVKGHTTHSTNTAWKAVTSLPNSAGSYYLTQSVTADWIVPTGEVNLCLNGQTISGKITVGSGTTLTLTDCSSDNSGKIQGGVTVNGGTLELYGGTIIGGVEVGRHSNPATGSAFTMYGGTISGNTDTGGVFLVGTTNHIAPPSFTMHGGTISNNTAGAPDGGGGGVYVGEKCSFTMDGGTITGNTATAGNGGGIYIHFNAGNVSISNATITGNKASATGNTSYGHGGGIYSERGVTVKGVTITGNNSTFEGGGIYGKGAITLTDATVTDNNRYDVYYGGQENSAPELTVSGSVQAGYYANQAWKLPILVSGALSEDSVIRVGVREGINLGAIAEPASGVTLRAENFKADAADCVTSLGDDGNVYLVPCTHEMDDTGYTCKKCHTQFDARIGESAYYKTLTEAFNAVGDSTVTLLRDVTLTGNCSATDFKTLDLNGKTVSTKNKYIGVGGGNKPNTLTVKDSGTGGGTQPLTVKFLVYSNGTLAVDDSYTGEISRVELQADGALERFGGKIGELVLSNAAAGSTSTGYGLKLWKGNTNACTIGKFTDNNKSKSLTVKDLLGTDYAKCELYGEKDGAWSIVPKTEKISALTGYTAYKVQFPECVHQCADDSNPVCSVCHKELYTKITAKAADGTAKTAYFTEDSALENGYVEAIQTLNGWSNEGCTEPTLTLLRDMYAFGTSMPLTGTLTLEGGTHTAKNVTVAKNADVTFASGSYRGATIDGTATVKEGVTFTDDATVTVNGTLNVEGGTFTGNVEFNGSSIANISGGSFTSDRTHGGVEFDYNVTGTISGGTFVFADFYTTKVKLSGGTFTTIKTNGDRKLADLLAEGAAYYRTVDDQAVTDDRVGSLENVKVVSHTHNGGTDGKGICSVCKKQMAASLTVGGKTSWYAAFATAIEAANAADGEKTITLYQDVNGYADGNSTTYELTRGPVTLATGGKKVTRVVLIAKGISLTVTDTGSGGDFNVTVDGKDAELTVNDKDTKLAIVTAKNGGKLSLSNGTFSRVDVMNDGSSASLSGGSYGEITSGNDYVKPYALLAKGYAYKRTRDNQWLPNANSIPEKVTVEKAPFAVEKIYPNSDTNYTGNSAFATDGNITLTAVIAPETQGVTYYYWWELFNESENDWTTHFGDVNNATHTDGQSKTLSISNLPENSIYQYRVDVRSDNGYQCYSEPFTVTRHEHSWTYTASGATITAKCSKCSASGGSVTIAAPAELTYSGEGKPAKVTASSDWQGPAAREITISYIKAGKYGQEKLENDALPTNAGTYTASITLGEATASVEYTIDKATLTVTPTGGQSKSYGTTPDPVLAYTSTGTVTGETAAFDGALSREAGEDVGTYNITKGSLALEGSGTFKATNYNLVLDTAVVTFEITKGTYSGSTPTKTVNILKNYAGVQTGILTAADFFTTAPAEAKITVLPSPGTVTIMSSVAVDASGNLTYHSKPNIAATADENCAVTISSKNYTDIIATLTFKLVDKTDVSAQITFPNGTLTYNGAGQKYEKATISGVSGGTWNYTYVANSGTGASLDSAGLPKTAGTYTVTAKYEDDAHIGTKPATLTVSKATPTGAPTCTKITTSGKTLADAPLAIGTITPAGGTLAWDMAANTVVAANTAYGWTYTPADTANYKALTGSLTPYAVSSGGGGGGGSYIPSYTVSVDKTVNGTITVSPKSASKGDTVTITVKPDKGYELDTLKVLDKNGYKVKLTEKNGKYTFTMPAGKVTVKGSFVEEAPEQIFTDVPVDAYCYEAVKWAAEKGITGGVGNGLFAPNQPCTRAQIVTFLWRAAGSPGPKTMSGFSDVPADSYYAKAVAWAVENGIAGGTGDGKFSPNAICTRAQAVTFLYRASGAPAVSGNAAFSDVATNAYYAAAVKWAEKNGITGGIGGGLFGSDNNCTRAQIVTFLYRNYQSK